MNKLALVTISKPFYKVLNRLDRISFSHIYFWIILDFQNKIVFFKKMPQDIKYCVSSDEGSKLLGVKLIDGQSIKEEDACFKGKRIIQIL